MRKPIDIFALLRRGGDLTPAEEKQLLEEMQEAKLARLSEATSERSWDQPVKVVPMEKTPPDFVGGYFTQEKCILGKTPAEMEAILGIYGRLSRGALLMQFASPLGKGDYETKAYSYLPDGKPYVPDPREKVFLPGKGAPQWKLTGRVKAECIARLGPGEVFKRKDYKG